MLRRLRLSEWLIAVGALVLLVATLMPWFAQPSAAEIVQGAPGVQLTGSGAEVPIRSNVWDLGFARWWVYLSIAIGIWLVLAALLSRTAQWATILATPLVLVTPVALICLLVRLVDPPRQHAVAQSGLIVALIGAVVLLVGALWSLRDESTPDGFEGPPRPELLRVD